MVRAQPKSSVVVVQRVLPHYRVPFFHLLEASNPDLSIRVCHSGRAPADPQYPFTARTYSMGGFQFLGFAFVVQPGLMVDVLRESPDLVVLEGAFGIVTNFLLLLLRRLGGRPTLYWTAGWENPAITGLRARVKLTFESLCLRLSSGAICYGSRAAGYLVERGCPSEKITIAQNAIAEQESVQNRKQWRRLGKKIRSAFAPGADMVLVYVGQLTPQKRVGVLLEAFALLRPTFKRLALLVVGDGSQRDELTKFADEHNIRNVAFVGEVVLGVEAYFAAGDVFVLPGTGGLAINQAMALGLPVVSSVADGTQDDLVVSGENGYIVAADDPRALAEAIAAILAKPALRRRMGASSLRIVQERASMRNMVQQFSKALHRACVP